MKVNITLVQELVLQRMLVYSFLSLGGVQAPSKST